MNRRIPLALVVAAAQGFALQSAMAQLQLESRVVVLDSYTPPGGAGGNFTGFDQPLINDEGEVAFVGFFIAAPGGVGAWVEWNGVLTEVVRASQNAEGTSSYPFTAVSELRIAKPGHVAFAGEVDDGSTGLSGFWVNQSGTRSLIALEGSSPSYLPSSAVLGELGFPSDFERLAYGIDGDVVITTSYDCSSCTVVPTPAVLNAVLSGTAGSLSVLWKQGDLVFDGGLGVGEYINYHSEPLMSPEGDVSLYFSELRLPGGVPTTGWEYFFGSPIGNFETGEHTPETDPDDEILFVDDPVVYSEGFAGFADMTADMGFPSVDWALWRHDGTSRELVLSEGDFIGGVGTITNRPFASSLRANLDGELVLTVEGTHPAHIKIDAGGTVSNVATIGDPAPGLGISDKFESFTTKNPLIVADGQIAIHAFATGSQLGLWATDESGALQLVIREGGQINVGTRCDVDMRTVLNFDFSDDYGTQQGRANAFNDRGELTLWISYDASATEPDGHGVFVIDTRSCPADFNDDGALDISDLLAYQNAFEDDDLAADWDCDGELTIFDFQLYNAELEAALMSPCPWY